MKNLMIFPGDHPGNYTVHLIDNKLPPPVAIIKAGEERTKAIYKQIKSFMDQHDPAHQVQIQNDEEYLGLIIDIYRTYTVGKEQPRHEQVNSLTIWFDEYSK